MSYKITLPSFEGPFDLLLFFIERDEIDIYDIPISKMTQDFLEYIQLLEKMSMEIASEFILVAGTLMRIKAKMLLPRPELDAQGKEIDPREELVSRLLAYKRYKSVLEDLAALEEVQQARVQRGNAKEEEKWINKTETPIEDLESLDAYTLLKIFKRVWDNHQHEMKKPKHVIRQYAYSMDEVKAEIKAAVEQQAQVDFVDFVLRENDRIYVVFSFLAMLELTQERVIRISAGIGYNQFWLVKRID